MTSLREQYEAAAEWLETAGWDALEDGATYDGCDVEPDGTCEHGYASFLLVLGII